jgi:hypothetical protein
MRSRILFVILFGLAAALSLSAQDKTSIRLPSNGSRAIVVMDYRGGYGPARKNNKPVLTIQANGKATVVDPQGTRPTVSYTLTPADIQNLMKSIVVEQDFFRIGRTEISNAMEEEDRKTGTSSSIIDASTTVLHVTTADQDLELRIDALGAWANKYPTIQALQRLFNVEKRLDRLIAEFKPGARESIAAALEAANNSLEQEHPGLPAITLNDFNETGSGPDGKSVTTFFRVYADRSMLAATVTASPGIPPQVTIETKDREKICFDDGKTCADLF